MLIPNMIINKLSYVYICCFLFISHLKISHMNICCCCLHKVNKLPEIKNEPRDLLTNVNKGKQVC